MRSIALSIQSLLAAACLFCSGAVHAQPDPITSTIGRGINLGGVAGGIVDPFVTKTMTIRDAASKPLEGVSVVITFTNCTNQDIRLCDSQPYHPDEFDCTLKTVTAVTNVDGIATFRIAGGADAGPGNPPGVGAGCATVEAGTVGDMIALGNLTVGAFDNNVTNGVNPADLANYAGDRTGFIFSPIFGYRGRSDFNGDGAVNPADTALILAARQGFGSLLTCTPTCF